MNDWQEFPSRAVQLMGRASNQWSPVQCIYSHPFENWSHGEDPVRLRQDNAGNWHVFAQTDHGTLLWFPLPPIAGLTPIARDNEGHRIERSGKQ
jgi:hypothetical protein